MPSPMLPVSLKANATFFEWVLDHVGGWLHRQDFSASGTTPSAGEVKSVPPLDPFCEGSHLATCRKCGSLGIVSKWFSSSTKPDAPNDTSNTLDLAIFANLDAVSARSLRLMTSADRDALLLKMSLNDVAKLDAEKLAALNPLNKVVPFLGDDEAPPSRPEYHEFIREDGTRHAKLKLSPNDRYYLVFQGLKFTGVVRGSHLYSIYGARGIQHAGGQAMNTRPEAEFAWLTAYYAGTCARVINAIVNPEVPVFV